MANEKYPPPSEEAERESLRRIPALRLPRKPTDSEIRKSESYLLKLWRMLHRKEARTLPPGEE